MLKLPWPVSTAVLFPLLLFRRPAPPQFLGATRPRHLQAPSPHSGGRCQCPMPRAVRTQGPLPQNWQRCDPTVLAQGECWRLGSPHLSTLPITWLLKWPQIWRQPASQGWTTQLSAGTQLFLPSGFSPQYFGLKSGFHAECIPSPFKKYLFGDKVSVSC